MPRVSVIIAVYNGADVLEKAFQSLVRQTFSDWECIMCDDASTDGTWEIVKDLSRRYDNCKVFRNEKNRGPAFSRNRCVEHAEGEYLAIQDADDLSYPNRFDKQVGYLDKSANISAVGSYASLFGDDELEWGTIKPALLPVESDWIKGPQVIHASVMCRKRDFVALNGYNEKMRFAEDYDLWVRYIALRKQIVTIPETLYSIRWDIRDYSRKGLAQRWGEIAVAVKALKTLEHPGWYFIYLLKPFAAGILPGKLLYLIHFKRFEKSKKTEVK